MSTVCTINPRDVIVYTLNGAIDLNSPKLTQLFRIDAGLSFKKEIYENSCLAAFIFRPLLDKLKLTNVKTESKETQKSGKISGRDDYAVLLFNKDGYKISKDPKSCIK